MQQENKVNDPDANSKLDLGFRTTVVVAGAVAALHKSVLASSKDSGFQSTQVGD